LDVASLNVAKLSLLFAALCAMAAACSPAADRTDSLRESRSPEMSALTQETQAPKEGNEPMTAKSIAEQTYKTVMKYYYLEKENLFLENFERKPDDKPNSHLWPYSTMISAVNALAEMPGGGEAYRGDLVRVLDGVEQYWQASGHPPGYTASLQKGKGNGRKFYDDNEWVGLDMVQAYRTLGDPKYLRRAEQIFELVKSGWSEELGGGIYWREWKENDPPPTKNTCSNGPAAVLALMLYEETRNADYLDWAKKILDWTRKLKADSGVYWDHMKSDGTIDKRTFTYNTGTVLHANALLYKITGEKSYLEEARSLAKASLAYFTKPNAAAKISFFPTTPWFNVVLFRGYLELYRVDAEHDRTYIDAMRANVWYAWEHARDERGLFSKDWSGTTGVKDVFKPLLNQAPMVEVFALLAQLE
jgi:hypothetical protein